MADSVIVAGVQMDVELGNVERNLSRMATFLEDKRLSESQLVVFPECAVTGYGFENRQQAMSVAEPLEGPSVKRLCELAARRRTYIAAGMLERDGEALFNICVLVGPEGIIGRYRKTHLPFLGIDRFSTAGQEPPPVFDLGFVKVGMHICYDASFPECTRLLMLSGADLVVLPTNWPEDAQIFAEHLAPVRAMENHLYFLLVNRVGVESGFPFIGQSCLCSPTGRTLATCGHEEGILVAAIEPHLARNKHIVREPDRHSIHRLRDRRPDLYRDLSSVG